MIFPQSKKKKPAPVAGEPNGPSREIPGYLVRLVKLMSKAPRSRNGRPGHGSMLAVRPNAGSLARWLVVSWSVRFFFENQVEHVTPSGKRKVRVASLLLKYSGAAWRRLW